MRMRFLAPLAAMCALFATIIGSPAPALCEPTGELPPLEGEIVIEGLIHPGTHIHPRFKFHDGKLIEFRQDWTVADDPELTTNVLRFSNYEGFTIPDEWDDKYMVCEITLDGYSGSIQTATFHSTHPYWMGSWSRTDGGHALKCPYCDRLFLEAPHDFSDETITKNPTCTEPGEATKTCATCKYSKTTVVPPLEHKWSDAIYEWETGHAGCLAKRVCEHDPDHVEICKGEVTSKVTKPAGHDTKGETTYTARFEAAWALEHSVTVADIDALPKPSQGAEATGDDAQAGDTAIQIGSDEDAEPTGSALPKTGDLLGAAICMPTAAALLFGLGASLKDRESGRES